MSEADPRAKTDRASLDEMEQRARLLRIEAETQLLLMQIRLEPWRRITRILWTLTAVAVALAVVLWGIVFAAR